MTNLRKVMAGAVSAAMFLGTMGVAMAQTTPQVAANGSAFTDVTASTPHATSIQELAAFGLINGVGNGQYAPSGNVTRAEFAKFVLGALGLGNSAQLMNNQSSTFSDVSTGQWYTGYVNMAAAKGIINGFPNGTFQPNGEVTYAQAITMLVRALGYSPFVTGSWPAGDLAEAQNIQDPQGVAYLMNGLNITDVNAPATRADVAKMVMNALYCLPSSVSQTTSGGLSINNQGATGQTGKPLMTVTLGLQPNYPGLTPFAQAASDTSAYAQTVRGIPSMDATSASAGLTVGNTSEQVAPGAVVLGGVNASLGQQVSDVLNQYGQLVFATPVTPSTSIVKGTAGSAVTIGAGAATSFSLELSNGGSQNITLSSATSVTVGLFNANQSTGTLSIAKGDPVTVVLGPSGDALAVIDNASSISDALITGVSTATSGNLVLTLEYNSGGNLVSQAVTVDPYAAVTLDGNTVAASALQVGMVVSADLDSNSWNANTVVASNQSSTTGTLTSVQTSATGTMSATIGGVQVPVATNASGNAVAIVNQNGTYSLLTSTEIQNLIQSGASVTGTLDASGNLAVVSVSQAATTDGIITSIVNPAGTANGAMTILGPNGQSATYTIPYNSTTSLLSALNSAAAAGIDVNNFVSLALGTGNSVSNVTDYSSGYGLSNNTAYASEAVGTGSATTTLTMNGISYSGTSGTPVYVPTGTPVYAMSGTSYVAATVADLASASTISALLIPGTQIAEEVVINNYAQASATGVVTGVTSTTNQNGTVFNVSVDSAGTVTSDTYQGAQAPAQGALIDFMLGNNQMSGISAPSVQAGSLNSNGTPATYATYDSQSTQNGVTSMVVGPTGSTSTFVVTSSTVFYDESTNSTNLNLSNLTPGQSQVIVLAQNGIAQYVILQK